jgi:hypothetical protein
MVIVEQFVEWRLAGTTEVLWENLLQCHFVHHKSHMTWSGLKTRTAAVGSQRLTAWAMARPITIPFWHVSKAELFFLPLNQLKIWVDDGFSAGIWKHIVAGQSKFMPNAALNQITRQSDHCFVLQLNHNVCQENLFDFSKKVPLVYMFMSCHHNGGQNDNINVANKSWNNSANSRYLEMTWTDRRFNSNRIIEYTDSGECNACKTKAITKTLYIHRKKY